MEVRDLIYEALSEHAKLHPEVTFEELAKKRCNYRHFLELSGKERAPHRPQDVLVREVEREMYSTVRGYFRGAFPKRFKEGSTLLYKNAITADVLGFLDDSVISLAWMSTSSFNAFKASKYSVVAAAVKAHLAGKDSAILLAIDRDKQKWAAWNISGDIHKVAGELLEEADYVVNLLKGEGTALGLASRNTCHACPFEKVCEMEPTKDPPMVSTKGLRVTPNPSLVGELDGHLWSLNQVKSTRKNGVIHPSDIATNPCDRSIAYGLNKVEKQESVDPRLRRIFDTGHAFHDVIQAALAWILPAFRAEVRARYKDLLIYGHCDGGLGNNEGLEAKSINANGFSKLTKAKSDHEKQATVYGVILGYEAIHYVYANKETGDIQVFRVVVDRLVWHKIATRATNIVRMHKQSMLPPQISKEYICKKCAFAWKCKPELYTPQMQNQTLRTFR